MVTRPADPSPAPTIVVVRTRQDLAAHEAAWDALAAQALDANIFYERTMLLSALDQMGRGRLFCVLLVYRQAEMIGFFPFWPALKGPRGMIRAYQSFTHLNCYLATPLVHRAHAATTIDGLLDWLDRAPDGARLMGLYKIAGDTGFATLLQERLQARRQPHFIEGSHERAFFEPAATAEAYLERALSAKKRKEYRRQRRRLEELGALSFTTVTGDDDAVAWADRFMDMEMRGWKGRGRAALDAIPGGRNYFRAAVGELARQGRAILHTMALDGKPIALKCNFIGAGGPPAGAFAYKITYDEDYAKFSPGVLLELHNIADLHARRGEIAWMDSCADPNHPMIDHLWDGRRRILYVTCGSRSLPGRLLVAALKHRNRQARKRITQQRQEGR